MLVLLGFLINFGLIATGIGEEEPVDDTPPVNVARLRQTLNELNTEIAGLQFPTLADSQAKTSALFGLAEAHGVQITSLTNEPPEAESFGPVALTKLTSSVTTKGPRGNVIDLLLELGETFGETTVISDVVVAGTVDDWTLSFVLTQRAG